MATRTAIIKTTTASQRDCSAFSTITGISIDATIPTDCDMRFALKIDSGDWQKYDSGAWADLSEQEITAASLLSEGNTKAELEALDSTALADLAGHTVNFAVAIEMEDTAEEAPSISSIEIAGTSGSTITQEAVESNAIPLSENGEAVEILNIEVSKTENGGSVSVLASIQDAGGSWSDYTSYTDLITNPATTAKAIKFKGVLSVTTPGVSSVNLSAVTIKHRTDNVAVFSEGTGVCITKTYNFVNSISRAHLMLKHSIVKDTDFSAFIALRKPPSYVEGEVLGTGTGAAQTVTLENTEGLASHGFALYFDGVKQEAAAYSFSPTDGQVTFTAPAGETVTVDYIHGWSAENFVPMRHDTEYPDKVDNTLVDDQFDYIAGDEDPTGTVGTIKVEIYQRTGKERNVALGTGTGQQESYKLEHHAKPETISVSPATATWRYKENTDILLVTAPVGEPVSVTYNWAARTNYLESIGCIFNE